MNEVRPENAPDAATMEAAANWRSRQDAGLAPGDQIRFEQWLTAKAQHAEAWRQVTAANQVFSRVRQERRTDEVIQEILRVRRKRVLRRAWWTAMLTLPAAAFWVFVVRTDSESAVSTAGNTAQAVRGVEAIASAPVLASEGEQRLLPNVTSGALAAPEVIKPEIQTLTDGTSVELRPGAEIAVSYTDGERRVTLLAGEAYFTVTKDKLRPFVVKSAQVSVRAVGTRFNVRAEPSGVNVLVTEGTVAVGVNAETQSNAGSSENPVLLNHGMQLEVGYQSGTLSNAQPQAASAAEIEELLSWRKPRLLLANTSLGEAVALLNREGGLRVVINDAALAALPLTGSCYADDARAFIRLIETALPVRCHTRADGVIELVARSDNVPSGIPQ